MSKTITLRDTKPVIFAAYQAALAAELAARRDLEAQRLATSIAQGNASMVSAAAAFTASDECDSAIAGRFAPTDAIQAPRAARTFMQNGVLMHKVCIGWNKFAIRPVAA